MAAVSTVPGVSPPVLLTELAVQSARGESRYSLPFGFIPDDQLATLYANRDAYVDKYQDATDAAIAAGFVLADDRDALLAEAQPDRLPA